MKRIVQILFMMIFQSMMALAQNQPEGIKLGTALNDQKKAELLTLDKDPQIKNGKVAILKGV